MEKKSLQDAGYLTYCVTSLFIPYLFSSIFLVSDSHQQINRLETGPCAEICSDFSKALDRMAEPLVFIYLFIFMKCPHSLLYTV